MYDSTTQRNRHLHSNIYKHTVSNTDRNSRNARRRRLRRRRHRTVCTTFHVHGAAQVALLCDSIVNGIRLESSHAHTHTHTPAHSHTHAHMQTQTQTYTHSHRRTQDIFVFVTLCLCARTYSRTLRLSIRFECIAHRSTHDTHTSHTSYQWSE